MATDLIEKAERMALPVAVAQPDDSMALFERLARDPNTSVEKIERLMALWERGEARRAETAFNVAMTAAQKQMRPVAADAENPQTRSMYASYEALDRALRPIYTEHGFSLSFNTGDSEKPEHVRVLCKARHDSGHAELYHLDMPADGKGAKGGDVMTKTHATGSAVSYGMRYLLKMIFNVAVGEDDDDGNGASQVRRPVSAPAGFEDWWIDVSSAADNGTTALQEAWNSGGERGKLFRRHAFNTNKHGWDTLKRKAAQVVR